MITAQFALESRSWGIPLSFVAMSSLSTAVASVNRSLAFSA
jgi:hypothetical protein